MKLKKSAKKSARSGFSLVQLSVLIAIASLVMVTTLPTTQSKPDANRITTERMNDLFRRFREYMAANGTLPCPADGTLAVSSTSYGVKAANGGSTNDCAGSSPAANYVDASNNVAVGMVPFKTLGIPKEYAYDGWGRAITYAVDTSVTGGCWTSPATGAITVTDNGSGAGTIIALVSHGANGHGAFIPNPTGTATRLNNSSTDSDELTNAHVDSSFVASSTLTSFIKKTPTSTFDDIIVYNSPNFTMNAMPAAAASVSGATISSVTASADGAYYNNNGTNGLIGYNITLTVALSSSVVVDTTGGTPRIALTAISVGGGSVSLTGNGGSGGSAYANYTSGTGTSSLTFTYPVQLTDMAPNGFTSGASIDLNGGTITTLCANSFSAPTLTGVIIPKSQAITATNASWTVPADWNSNFYYFAAIGSGGNGSQGVSGTGATVPGGTGGGGGAFAMTSASSSPAAINAGDSLALTIGAGGGTTKTKVAKGATTIVEADYGKNAVGTTRGTGGTTAASSGFMSETAGGNGGNNGGNTRGGGGGGGGAAGADLTPQAGKAGGAGANTGGGGGGGGGVGGANSTNGSAGAATGSNGGHGGRGPAGATVSNSNRGAAGGGNASAGAATFGIGGGGGGGSNSASVNSGSGGGGSVGLYSGTPPAYDSNTGWYVNIAPTGYYGPSAGGGGSGGANGATSNSGNAGNGGTYGGGGGGSGGATGTVGAAGSGGQGLIVIMYR